MFAWALSPDGKVVAYFKYASEKKSVRVLDVGTKEEKGLPYDDDLITTLAFSGDGRYLLGYDSKSAYYLTWDKPSSRLWRVDDGVEETSWGAAHYATWSPDGSALAYLLLDSATAGAEKPGLYLSEGPGKPGKLVYEGQFLSPTTYGPLTWATDNTILLASMDKNKLLRLHLGTK